MVVMRLNVEPSALAASDDGAVGVAVSDVDEQFRLAGAATVGFVAAALAKGLARLVFQNIGALDIGFVDEEHVELGHGALPFAGIAR